MQPPRLMSTPLPAQPPAADEIATLLNRAVLRLGSEIRTARLHGDRLVVKYQPGRQYLVVTQRQWDLLQQFGAGRTVTSVVCAAIDAQHCPPLREFYELVVKAARAGVLQCDLLSPPPPAVPARWRFRLPGSAVRWLAAIFFVLAAISVALRPAQLPEHPGWLVLGWLTACAAASAGWVLAAGVVRSAGGDVYRPRFVWLTLAPRFRVDLSDAVLGGRPAEINTALARFIPLLVFIAAAAWWAPGLLGPLLAGLMLQLSPLWRSPLHDWLRALYHDPHLATAYDFVLAKDRLFTLLGRARDGIEDRRFLAACALATVAWLALGFLGGCALWHANAAELFHRFNAAGGWHYTALVLLAFFGALVAGSAAAAIWIVLAHLQAWRRERAERRLRPQAILMSPETMAEWLGHTVLFRDLAPADLSALAAAFRPEEHRRGGFVVREGEAGDRLYVVVSGRLEVRRDYAPGRSEPVAEMVEGEVFGEIALLEGGTRTRSIRCLSASVLLVLDKADFDRLVLSRLSRQAVEDAVQKVAFLQQAGLTRHWTHATMADFARRARLQEYPEGTVILQEGAANHWFYLVRRGELVVRLNGKELRRLKTGDSFGELSLMGDGVATASVVVRSKVASCVAVNGRDFLEFITRDFAAGLRWEELKPRRLEQTGKGR